MRVVCIACRCERDIGDCQPPPRSGYYCPKCKDEIASGITGYLRELLELRAKGGGPTAFLSGPQHDHLRVVAELIYAAGFHQGFTLSNVPAGWCLTGRLCGFPHTFTGRTLAELLRMAAAVVNVMAEGFAADLPDPGPDVRYSLPVNESGDQIL